MSAASSVRVFSTCPPSVTSTPEAYLRQVEEIASWSEDAGCEGILITTDNGQVDPWLVSQAIIGVTRTLCPLIAVQPVYMHPYSTFVLDVPADSGEMQHVAAAFGAAADSLAA